MFEEASAGSVEAMLFDVGHECFEGNCQGGGNVL
jgi:hypothetical protein